MKIKLIRTDPATGQPVEETVECGTYTFERNDQHGPLILTFLRGEDRKDAGNEPLRVVSGVRDFEVVEGGQNAAQTK